MEKLISLLRKYNINHKEDCYYAPWNQQFCGDNFPYYWTLVYEILEKFDHNSSVIEIGSGLGTITSILCYHGYTNILSFERDQKLAELASMRLKELFGRIGIIQPLEYSTKQQYHSDVLILVNCSYGDMSQTKEEYKNALLHLYESAGSPTFFIMEVIDDSYTRPDKDFPEHIRLNNNDIKQMFPTHSIKSWSTYIYPVNQKSKTLYLIEKI